MKPMATRLASCAFLLSCTFRAFADTPAPSLDLRVAVPPTPVNTGGSLQLAYELQMTNSSADTLEIGRVRVAGTDVTLADFTGAALDAVFAKAIAAPAGGPGRLLAPGATAIVYLNLVPDSKRPMPASLRHVVAVYRARPGAAHIPIEIEGGAVAVGGEKPVVIAVGGHARIPARFAIDWIKLDEAGRYAHDDATRVANWYGYAADVLAVADGVVAATRDDRPESASTNAPTKNAPTKNTLENASGNYVVLDIGHGRYAAYEHLKPGSVRVKPGDRVTAGAVIGALGYTGDSTGPHLHFHLSDGADTLAAEGMPYVFDRYDLLGAYASMDAFGEKWQSARDVANPRRAELPAANSVIVFSSNAAPGDAPAR